MASGTNSDVRSMVGVPIAADFYSAKGTPIVINTSTGVAYVLNSAGSVVEVTHVGYSGTITTATLVGKTITVVNGVITGFS